jgi:hypothetical protein
MNVPPHDAGLWKEVTSTLAKILDVLMRPLDVASNAISGRLEILLKRKPRLFVNFHPLMELWCLAFAGDKKIMQVCFMADFSHDDPDQTILLIDAYLKGTKPWMRFDEPIRIPPGQLVRSKHVEDFFVTPIIGTPGKNWTGRIIFKDHLHRPYKSEKFEFVWTGPTELPAQYKPKLENK